MLDKVKKKYVETGGLSGIQKALKIGTTALQIANGIRMLVNSEHHKYLGSFTGQNVTDSGTIFHLSNIAGGSLATQRSGNSILLRNLRLNLLLSVNASAQWSLVRFIVFTDTMVDPDHTTAPVVGDVLTTANVLALKNIENTDRFHIHYDQVFTLAATGREQTAYKEFFKKMDYHIRWVGDGANDYDEGHLYCLAVGTATTYYPLLSMHFQLTYMDN